MPTEETIAHDLNKMPLHKALKFLRKKYVGTQDDMAKALGMSTKSNHVALVESGKSKLSADKLELWLALCFHKTTFQLMSPSETREKLLAFKK